MVSRSHAKKQCGWTLGHTAAVSQGQEEMEVSFVDWRAVLSLEEKTQRLALDTLLGSTHERFPWLDWNCHLECISFQPADSLSASIPRVVLEAPGIAGDVRNAGSLKANVLWLCIWWTLLMVERWLHFIFISISLDLLLWEKDHLNFLPAISYICS